MAFISPISLLLSSTVVLMVPVTLLPAEIRTTAVTMIIRSLTLASKPFAGAGDLAHLRNLCARKKGLKRSSLLPEAFPLRW